MLAAEPDQPVQFIDVRNLANWVLDAGERGTYNATGPARRLTMTELLAACRDVTGGDATPVWAGDRRLLDHGLEPWEDLPFWLPDKSPASAKSTRPPPRRPACTFAR